MTAEHRTHLREVLDKVSAIAPDIPAHRAAFKQGYSFSAMPFDEQLAVWQLAWQQKHNHRARIHAYFFLEQHIGKEHLHSRIWDTSKLWQKDVDSWDLCDSLSKINTKLLETFPDEVYAQLVSWNTNNDLWMRRQSVVSLLYYSRTKKSFLSFSKLAPLVLRLLSDDEYYVQKGIGWTLRELHNVYPERTLALLQKNIKHITPIAFTTAIEKMDIARKDILKALRR
jgi:3-methyladenine DNA glycosylase AlkD